MQARAVRFLDSMRRRLLPARASGSRRKAPGSEGVQGVVPHGMWDLVDEASWESFPASDPPALNVEEHRTFAPAAKAAGAPPAPPRTARR